MQNYSNAGNLMVPLNITIRDAMERLLNKGTNILDQPINQLGILARQHMEAMGS
jgi:hypothetical protein